MNILFVGPTYIGDAAICTGLVQALLERYPSARLTIAAGATAVPLFAAVPGLERLWPIVKRKPIGHWFDLWRATLGKRWEAVVDLRGSGLAWFLWARERRIFRPDSSKGHRSQALAAVLGLDNLPTPRLWVGPEAAAAAAKLVPPDGPPILALGPTGRYAYKLWRPEAFAELAGHLTAATGPLPGARIAVLGAAHERSLTEPIFDRLPEKRRIDLVGATDLATVAAVLQRAAMFVGVDSGLLYVATAAAIPTVGLLGPTRGLFGPESGDLVAPWAPKVAIARTPEAVEDLAAPTHAERIVSPPQLDSLSVETVEAVANSLLARLGGQNAAGSGPAADSR